VTVSTPVIAVASMSGAVIGVYGDGIHLTVAPYESHRKHDDLLSTLTYSALISARKSNTGWYRPMYIFPRFISDCAKYSGFDAIKSPSTRTSDDSYNLVKLNNELSLKNISTVSRLMGYTKDGEENIPQ